MTESTPEPEIRQVLAQVRHPEIANTLVDLGMLKDVVVEGNKVGITLLVPFVGIPIQVRDYIIDSLHQALTKVDASLEVEINIAEMSQDEIAKFIKMAQEGWLG
ncbi:MAG TPA: iron-sulfur cluster assembly protein [Dehalococcoidia bacterium]|nr:iron-sulfur cluster assembly protein [Dehalococcoidia bacterium]